MTASAPRLSAFGEHLGLVARHVQVRPRSGAHTATATDAPHGTHAGISSGPVLACGK